LQIALLAVLHLFGCFASKPGESSGTIGLAPTESECTRFEVSPLPRLHKRNLGVESNFLSVGILLAAGIAATPLTEQQPRKEQVRVVYVIPRDRKPWPEFNNRVSVWLKDTQWYFACQMHAHGFGWRTFDYAKGADGNAQVVVLQARTPNDAMFSLSEVCKPENELLDGYIKRLSAREQQAWKSSVVILFRETLQMKDDGSLLFGTARGGNKRAYVTSAYLRLGHSRLFMSATPPEGFVFEDLVSAAKQGHQNPDVLQKPLKATAFKAFSGSKSSVGKISSRCYGGPMHELGHAFGLSHTGTLLGAKEYERRLSLGGNWLMSTHFTNIGGNFVAEYRDGCAGLAKEEAAILAKSPFFWKVMTDKEAAMAPSTGAPPTVGGRTAATGARSR